MTECLARLFNFLPGSSTTRLMCLGLMASGAGVMLTMNLWPGLALWVTAGAIWDLGDTI